MDSWFMTWDRPEYREWAKENQTGYSLLIIRRENDGEMLCAKAQLIIHPTGLPEFVIQESCYFTSQIEADNTILSWQKE